MKLVFNDHKFLRDVVRVFLSKREVTVEVRQEYISMCSHGQSRIYSVIEDSLFATDAEDLVFTVRTQHLVEGLEVLEGDFVLGERLKLAKEGSTVTIPLVTTVDDEYEEVSGVTTKFVVGAAAADALDRLRGLVTYEIEDGSLFIRKRAGDVIEEVELLKIDFIVMGELKFQCNNDWTETLGGIKEHIENIMVAFSENFLCVQFLFRKYSRSYLELQIPRSLVE